MVNGHAPPRHDQFFHLIWTEYAGLSIQNVQEGSKATQDEIDIILEFITEQKTMTAMPFTKRMLHHCISRSIEAHHVTYLPTLVYHAHNPGGDLGVGDRTPLWGNVIVILLRPS